MYYQLSEHRKEQLEQLITQMHEVRPSTPAYIGGRGTSLPVRFADVVAEVDSYPMYSGNALTFDPQDREWDVDGEVYILHAEAEPLQMGRRYACLATGDFDSAGDSRPVYVAIHVIDDCQNVDAFRYLEDATCDDFVFVPIHKWAVVTEGSFASCDEADGGYCEEDTCVPYVSAISFDPLDVTIRYWQWTPTTLLEGPDCESLSPTNCIEMVTFAECGQIEVSWVGHRADGFSVCYSACPDCCGGGSGEDGTAATITVGTTTTGAPGTDASVANVGTTSAAILDFIIPRGDTGATGATGDTGATGPAGAGFADGDYGDITISGSVTALTIDANVVSFAKFQDISTDRLLGRDTAGTGDPEEISLNATLEFTGSGSIQRAALTGDVTASAGSNTTTIPNNTVTYAKMQDVSAASKLLGKGDSGSGDPEEITLGTNLSMSGTTLNATAATTDYIYLQDQKASGTAGGTFTSGGNRTRTLNQEVTDTGGHCTLASNQFTLAAGTYEILAFAPAYGVDSHQAKLVNTTAGANLILGTTMFAQATVPTANFGMNHSVVAGKFTVAASQALEIQHTCTATLATNGFGPPASFGTEIYTQVNLWKVG